VTDDDLRAELKHADPAASLAPVAPETVSRLLDRAMARSIPRPTRPGARLRRGVLVAAEIVALVAVGAVVLHVGAKTDRTPDPGAAHTAVPRSVAPFSGAEPGPTTVRTPALTKISLDSVAAADKCPVRDAYQLAADAHVAFEGTVRGIADGVVTLQVDHVWVGDTTDLVEIADTDTGTDTAPLLDGVVLAPGKRYLIAVTTGGQLMTCGYSGPADPKLLGLYDDAF